MYLVGKMNMIFLKILTKHYIIKNIFCWDNEHDFHKMLGNVFFHSTSL